MALSLVPPTTPLLCNFVHILLMEANGDLSPLDIPALESIYDLCMKGDTQALNQLSDNHPSHRIRATARFILRKHHFEKERVTSIVASIPNDSGSHAEFLTLNLGLRICLKPLGASPDAIKIKAREAINVAMLNGTFTSGTNAEIETWLYDVSVKEVGKATGT
jgi:hypothetical protein